MYQTQDIKMMHLFGGVLVAAAALASCNSAISIIGREEKDDCDVRAETLLADPCETNKTPAAGAGTDGDGTDGDGADSTSPTIALLNVDELLSLNAPTTIRAKISDNEAAQVSWQLVAASSGASEVLVSEGSAPSGAELNIVVDPDNLPNGNFELILTANDPSENESIASFTSEINWQLPAKQLAFVDYEFTVDSVSVKIERQYNSLTKEVNGGFGKGWTFKVPTVEIEYRNLSAAVAFTTPTYNGLTEATEVAVTLNLSQGTELFEFDFDAVVQSIFMPGRFWPVFNPFPGNSAQLSVDQMTLVTTAPDTFSELSSGMLYNPVNPLFGGFYDLTRSDGTIYEINSQSEEIYTITGDLGSQLLFLPGKISHSNGDELSITKNPIGQVTSLTGPAGFYANYSYDPEGNLIRADINGEVTEYKYFGENYPHYPKD